MEKFCHFLYADQKPLETTLPKSIYQATPRLQYMLRRTFLYHLTIRYIPKLTNQIAECLLRLGGQKDTIKLPKLYLYQITSQLNARSDSLNQLRVATQDDVIALLKQIITQGWSSNINKVPCKLQPYWTFREELTIEDWLVWKCTRIVIPNKKDESILKLIHEGHLGLNKCKLCAKETVYWSGLNAQLEKLILNCELCLKYSQSKCKQPPTWHWGKKYQYTHGQSLWQRFFILKVCHNC